MIYFLRFKSGLIKIGTASNLETRLQQIKTDPNYGEHEVLRVIEGYRDTEQKIHRVFHHLRTHPRLELFHPGEDLLHYIQTLEFPETTEYKPASYMALGFRDIPKELCGGQIPAAIERRIREEAFRLRTSISAVLTHYVVKGMELDPAQYGLDSPAA